MIEFLKAISFSIISSLLFYYIVVYRPRNKENEIAKNFIIGRYKNTQLSVVHHLLDYLNKRSDKKLENNILNYDYIRTIITDNDMDVFRAYTRDPDKFSLMNKEILAELDTLKASLNHILSYGFIKENENAVKRLCCLIDWINKFSHRFNSMYDDKDTLEYSKLFCRLIDESVRGYDCIKGEQKRDDFVDVVDEAYAVSLWSTRVYNFLVQILDDL